MNRKIEVGCMVMVKSGVETGKTGTVLSLHHKGEFFLHKYARGIMPYDAWLVDFGPDRQGLFSENNLMRIDDPDFKEDNVETETEKETVHG